MGQIPIFRGLLHFGVLSQDIIGIGFIFFIIAQANLDAFRGININEYSVFWAIGYEVIASILLLLIVKSAIRFKRL